MKFDQLYYFLEACTYQSISTAARKNFVPQSTVSTAIANLEKELGASLLKRSNKGVSPTASGTIVFEKSKHIMQLMKEIQETVHSSEHYIKMTISAMPSLVDTIMADLILEIEQENYLQVEVFSDEPTEILQSIQLGLVDAGLLFYHQANTLRLKYTDLNFYELFTDEYCLFVGERSPLFNRKSVSIGEALNNTHIAYKSEFENEENVLTKLISPFGKPDVALRVDNTESMRRLIAKSHYVAFFPRFTMKDDPYIDYEWIHALPIDDADLRIDVDYVESNLFKDRQANRLIKERLKIISEISYKK